MRDLADAPEAQSDSGELAVEPKLGKPGTLGFQQQDSASAFEPFGRWQLKLFGNRRGIDGGSAD